MVPRCLRSMPAPRDWPMRTRELGLYLRARRAGVLGHWRERGLWEGSERECEEIGASEGCEGGERECEEIRHVRKGRE